MIIPVFELEEAAAVKKGNPARSKMRLQCNIILAFAFTSSCRAHGHENMLYEFYLEQIY